METPEYAVWESQQRHEKLDRILASAYERGDHRMLTYPEYAYDGFADVARLVSAGAYQGPRM